jgi:large subunit ribosomal protein L5
MAGESDKKQQQGKGSPGKGAGGARSGATKKGGPSKGHGDTSQIDTGPKTPSRLRILFDGSVRGKITEKFGIKNPMAMPKLEKIVLNVNMGRHLEGTKLPPEKRQTVLDTLTKISGQKPVVVKAKKSVSNFKVREGFETAAMVTLRRDRMWHFLDRFINLATPRIRDFRGVNDKAFDKQGNYAVGVSEQGVFPEINMAEVNFTHGMNINVCFQRSTPALSRFVLECLGMPFVKPEEKKKKS